MFFPIVRCSNHLCFYGANRKPVQFSKFKDRGTVLATIFQQVQGTGLHLESYLAERGVTADQAYVPRAKAPREVVLKSESGIHGPFLFVGLKAFYEGDGRQSDFRNVVKMTVCTKRPGIFHLLSFLSVALALCSC
jgi:hypothetical protein